MSKEVKSDGGSSKYYQLTVRVTEDKIENATPQGEVKDVTLETGDVIRALVDNDFDLGNCIKAIRRIHQSSKGEGKSGTSIEYDVNKIKYFLDEWVRNVKLNQL